MNEFKFNPGEMAGRLEELLNNEETLRNNRLTADSLNPIAKNTSFKFCIHPETGEYKTHGRTGNFITRYINCELDITGSEIEGTEESNFVARVQTRVECIIPMLGSKKNDSAVLNAVRNHISDTLRFADGKYIDNGGGVYLQVVSFAFATTGLREHLPMVGDAISLSFYATFSYILSGISSEGIRLSLMAVNGEEKNGEDGIPIPYSKLGIARKLTTEINVSAANGNASVSKSLPVSSILTINMDLLARLTVFDEAARDYRLRGQIDTLKVKVREIKKVIKNVEENNLDLEYDEMTYDMILDMAGFNAEQGAICSQTVTLVERSVLDVQQH